MCSASRAVDCDAAGKLRGEIEDGLDLRGGGLRGAIEENLDVTSWPDYGDRTVLISNGAIGALARLTVALELVCERGRF